MGTASVIYDLIGRDRASSAFKSAGDSADKMASRVSKLGIVVAAAGTAVAGAAVEIATKSVEMATDFEASMEKIHTQAGGTQKDVESLTASVLKLAPSTQQGPQALSEALYHLKSVGLDNAAAMKDLKVASDLAAVGSSNLEDTTNALAGAWRSGIKGAQTFGQTAATVNAIIGAGNMSMTDLTAAMSTGILPAAKTFGLSLTSIGSALATMTDEGVPAEEAASRLRMTISLIGAPSAAAAKQLASIGVSSTSLATAMRSNGGLISALTLLKTHLTDSGMTAEQQAQVLSRAFGGGQSSSAIMTLINNLSVVETKQKQINDTVGQYGGAVAAQRQTAQAQFAILRSSVDTLGIRLGLALLPPVNSFVKFLAGTAVPDVAGFAGKVAGLLPVAKVENDVKKISAAISSLLGGTKTKTPAVEVPYTVAGTKSSTTVSMMISKQAGSQISSAVAGGLNAFDFGSIAGKIATTLVSTVFQAVGKINWASAGGTATADILEFALGLVSSLLDPVTWFHVLQKAWMPIIGILLTVITIPFGGEGGTLFKGLADVLEHLPFGKLVAWIPRMMDALAAPLARFWRGMLRKAFSPVTDAVKGVFEGAQKWLVDAGETMILKLWYGAEDAWPKLTGWLGKIGGWIIKIIGAPYAWLYKAGSDMLGGLLGGAKDYLPDVAGWLRRIGGWTVKFLGAPYAWLYQAGVDLLSGMLEGSQDYLPKIGVWLGSLPGRVAGWLSGAGSWLLDVGVNVINGLINGITSRAGALKDKIFGLGRDVIGWAKDVWDMASPSKKFYELGAFITQGLALGINETTAQVKAAAVSLATQVIAAFNAGQITGPEENSLLGRISTGLSSRTLTLARQQAAAYASKIGAEITARIGSGITQTMPAAQAAAAKLMKTISAALAKGQLTSSEAQSLFDRISADLSSRKDKLVKTMQSISLKMRDGLLGSLEDATTASAVNSAVSKLESYVQSAWSAGDISTGQASGLTSFLQADNARLQKLATQRAGIAATIKTAQDYAANVTSNTESFASLSGITSNAAGKITSATVLSGLQADLTAIDAFNTAVNKLAKAGLRQDLLDQIIQMGPADGMAVALALLKGPVSGIKQANAVQAKITTASAALGKTAADAMYDSGAAAGKGFLSGLESQEKAITSEMDKIADSMVGEIEKKLKIHSPSLVMDQRGQMVGLGLAQGMNRSTRHVLAAASLLTGATALGPASLIGGGSGYAAGLPALSQPVSALSPAESKALLAAASRGGGDGAFSGTLVLDSGELLGVIDGRIQADEKETVRALKSGSGRRR